MKNSKLKELNSAELIKINAGESGWYWVAYYANKALNYAKPGGHNMTTVYTDGSYMYF